MNRPITPDRRAPFVFDTQPGEPLKIPTPLLRALQQCFLGWVGGLSLVALAPPAFGFEDRLETPEYQKAAVACQKVIGRATIKVLAGELKALDVCAQAALTCEQTKQPQRNACEIKAEKTCVKQIARIATLIDDARRRIVTAKPCASTVSFDNLVGAEGLGLERLVERCSTDFGLTACTLDTMATCLVQASARTAATQYGETLPRTAELLRSLPNAFLPPVDGLPVFSGCDRCDEPEAPACKECEVRPPDPKAVEQCAKAATKATRTLTAKLGSRLIDCAQKALACAQNGAGEPACAVDARRACDGAASQIPKFVDAFTATLTKKCEGGFGAFMSASGLHFEVLAALCPALEVTPSAPALAACLHTRVRDALARSVGTSVARLSDFDESLLGGLCSDLGGACTGNAALRLAPARGIFGSISKVIRFLSRAKAPGIVTTTKTGPRPTSSGGGPRLSVNSPPTRVRFGGITKIPFRYQASPSRRAHAAILPAPKLLVSVQRADALFDDYFEIDLDVPVDPSIEQSDELVIQLQDILPACTFDLALAISDAGVVSDYTVVPQRVDETPAGTGMIVVAADEWPFTNQGFGASYDAVELLNNVTRAFAGDTPGAFHAYSNNLGFTGSALDGAMKAAGHAWTVDRNVAFDLATLQAFDGVFFAETNATIDFGVLTQYVASGGNVYIAAGTTSNASGVSKFWNPFLNAYGLSLEASISIATGSSGDAVAIAGSHPILAEVLKLFFKGGQAIIDLEPTNDRSRIIAQQGSKGLFGVYGGEP